MKKHLLLPALLALAIPLVILGCAGTQKVTKDLNQAAQAITETSQAVNQVVNAATTAATQTLNTVDKTVIQVQTAQADAQRLATRVEGLPHYDRHVVVKGDTLWRYSRKTYKTGFLWPLISEQNGLPDGNLIRVGDVVRIAPASMLSTYSADELDRYRQTAYRQK